MSDSVSELRPPGPKWGMDENYKNIPKDQILLVSNYDFVFIVHQSKREYPQFHSFQIIFFNDLKNSNF